MTDTTDRDEAIKLTVVVGALVAEVRALGVKVDNLKDEHVFDLERQLAVLQSQTAASNDRLKKIEEQFTWLTRTVAAEGIALLCGIIMWAIQNLG